MHGFVILARNGEQFRQFDTKRYRNVGFLADDAALFNGQRGNFRSSVVVFSVLYMARTD